MASNYTEEFRLCQWSASDHFLRTEFNSDNQKIDTALGQLVQRMEYVERQMPQLQHRVYNLMLQQYYDGKESRYQKALFFDGFLDESRVMNTVPGAYYDSGQRRMRVVTNGAKSEAGTFALPVNTTGSPGSDGDKCYWVGWSSGVESCYEDRAFIPSGFGKLNSVTLRMAAYYNGDQHAIDVRAQILDGSDVIATSGTVTVSGQTVQDYTISFPAPPDLAPKEYTLRVENINQGYYLRLSYQDGGQSEMGAGFTYTPTVYSTGSFTCTPTDLGQNYQHTLAWVRHIGGSVGLAVGTGGGGFTDMDVLSTVQTVNLLGENCKETAFRLDAVSAGANNQMTARLSMIADENGYAITDYGIVFY